LGQITKPKQDHPACSLARLKHLASRSRCKRPGAIGRLGI